MAVRPKEVSQGQANASLATSRCKTHRVPSGSGLRQASFKAGPGNSNFDDKQWVTVDNSPTSSFYGRVYVRWTKFDAQGGQSSIWLSSCGGNGESNEVCEEFTRGHVVNQPVAGDLVRESFPTTAPDGTLYIAFTQFQGGFGSTRPHSGVWILKSTDGGDTFTQQQVVDIQQIPARPRVPSGREPRHRAAQRRWLRCARFVPPSVAGQPGRRRVR
jgi:hypothetical protein